MKLQLTSLATVVSLTLSGVALAQQTPTQNPGSVTSTGTVTTTTNLGTPTWGVNNQDLQNDNNKWNNSSNPAENNFNWARIRLTNEPSNNVQTGEVESIIEQDNNGATINEASVSQDGSTGGQYSKVRQVGEALKADVDQRGDSNYSDVNQELSSGGIVNVLQVGSENASRVEQFGANNNGANVIQTGIDNNSFIRQGTAPGGAENNNAFVNQTGDQNESYIGQTNGSDNWAYASQDGDMGTSYIIQQGSDNDAQLLQVFGGSNNKSYIMQDNAITGGATANYASVEQSGSDNISTVTQISQSIGNATVIQGGAGNLASTLQY